jgi:hypothetical protein
MAKYPVTYGCGHEGVLHLAGKDADRQWEIRRAEEGLCPECYEAERIAARAAKNAASKAASEELGLPALTGSIRQVEWATTIRQQTAELLEQKFRPAISAGNKGTFDRAVAMLFADRTSASWWIDRRELAISGDCIRKELGPYIEAATAAPEGGVLPVPEPPAPEKHIVRPEDQQHSVPVEVLYSENRVEVHAPKNDALRELVKSLGYTWDGECWARKITFKSGSAEDRAAELVNRLLAAGFAVQTADEALAQKAAAADFKPEVSRWVSLAVKGRHAGKLFIDWTERNDALYQRARRLPGAQWDGAIKSFIVPAAAYREVRDFAEMLGFGLSAGAEEVLREQQALAESALRVTPATAPEREEVNKLAGILETRDDGVLDDLKDDPL